MEFDLKKTLWALLLAEGNPISAKKFQDFVHRSFADRFLALSELKLAVEEINIDLASAEAPYRISETPNGYVIRLVPDYAELVRNFKGEPRPQKLTPAAMETLAIVAYRQPITKSQVEAIRGVSADGPLGKLQELNLVEGKPNETLPGRPMVYSTTSTFLEQCGLRNLDELPQTEDGENERLREFFRKQEEPAEPTQEELPAQEASDEAETQPKEDADSTQEKLGDEEDSKKTKEVSQDEESNEVADEDAKLKEAVAAQDNEDDK